MAYICELDSSGISRKDNELFVEWLEADGRTACEMKYVKERTCKPEVEHHGDLILTRYPCCGYELKEYRYSPYPEVAFNNCPNCGAKVIPGDA